MVEYLLQHSVAHVDSVGVALGLHVVEAQLVPNCWVCLHKGLQL